MRGFAGNSAEHFFNRTNEAVSRASESHKQEPLEDYSYSHIPPVRLPSTPNQRPPFPEGGGTAGAASVRHPTGKGNSSNIVMDPFVYEEIARRADMLDDQAGAGLYRIASAIEEMCRASFVMPEAVPQILAITDRVKGSLGQFRSLTEDANIQTRKFADEIMGIDGFSYGGGGHVVAVSEAPAETAVRNASTTMDRQAENMDRTAEAYKSRKENLDKQLEREKEMQKRMQMKLQMQMQNGFTGGFQGMAGNSFSAFQG